MLSIEQQNCSYLQQNPMSTDVSEGHYRYADIRTEHGIISKRFDYSHSEIDKRRNLCSFSLKYASKLGR